MNKLVQASLAIALMGGTALTPAWGQDVRRFAPQTGGNGAPAVLKGPDIPPGMEDAKPLVKNLRGVVIVGKPTLVRKTGTTGDGVAVRDPGVVMPEGALAAIKAHIGKPVSLKSLGAMSREIVLAFRDADLPVVNVAAPEQDISNGVLQLIVVVGRLGDVRVEGNQYFPAEVYLDKFSSTPGQVIDGGRMLDDLRHMNRNPFRRVDAVYAPGQGFGMTDVALRPTEYRPFAVFAGYNNDGNTALGIHRVNLGFMVGNMLGLDEVLAYQVTTTKDFKNLYAHVASAQFPLANRAELQITGALVTSDVQVNPDVHSSGGSKQLSAHYVKQLPRFLGWSHDGKLGVEYKETNNNLEFGGNTVSDKKAEVYQLVAGWSGEMVTRFGHTRAHVNTYFSPGNISNLNSVGNFDDLRKGAESRYAYARFGLDHRIDTQSDWRVNLSLAGQIANQNLLASESFTLGGQGSVRGFETNLSRGDNGFTANMTVYTPGIALVGPFQRKDWAGAAFRRGKGEPPVETVHDQLRAFAFIDYGWASSHTNLQDEVNRSLAGTGVGLAYEVGRHTSVELAYGWQILEKGIKDSSSGFLHLRGTQRF